jgi:predicted dehydrogenase
MTKLRLAVIGCGAVAKIYYLPAIVCSNQFDLTVLVDKSLENVRQLSDRYGVSTVVDDYHEIIEGIDAAIVALPNYLHAPVAIDLLQHGSHVLVEKPMALKTSECDDMIKAASSAGTVLAVGLDFRFLYSSQFVKQLIENGLLGDIMSFDVRQGVISHWPMSSDYLLRKEAAGGGVLVDFGVHVLDLLLWWLGDYDSVEYYDDAVGGVEANCELHLRLKCGASGVVELSRMRNLSNTCIIHGTRGTLEVGIWDFNPSIRLKIKNQDFVLDGQIKRDNESDKNFIDVFRRQLDDFADDIVNHREPFISGQEGKRAIELIAACYASKQLLKQQWIFPETIVHGV